MEAMEHCGLFGKLPQQADFVRIHLPLSFTEYWHTWLQSALSVSREQLGDEWLDLFLTSPVWRFAIEAGVACEQAVVGVIIPSVDEIGRYFPLTIAHCGPHAVWDAYHKGEQWYEIAEKLALNALEDGITYSRLIQQLEEVAPPEFEALPRYEAQLGDSQYARNAWCVAQPAEPDKQAACLGLLHSTYRRLLGAHSLWWTSGSEQVAPCLLVAATLPDAGQYAALLDGHWAHWGWSHEVRKGAAEASA